MFVTIYKSVTFHCFLDFSKKFSKIANDQKPLFLALTFQKNF